MESKGLGFTWLRSHTKTESDLILESMAVWFPDPGFLQNEHRFACVCVCIGKEGMHTFVW